MKNASSILIAVLVSLQLAACGKILGNDSLGSWSLQSAEKLPAASGQVRVAKGDQGNKVVTVSVEHLARPADAFPGTSAYVVWLIPDENKQAQNVGAIQVGADLKGELTTKTAFHAFQIVVTAENEPNVTEPSGNRAMTATVSVPG